MSLSDFYETASPRSKYKAKPCKVCVWYDTLDAAGKAFFDGKINGNVTKLWLACLDSELDADFCLTSVRSHKRLCLSCR